jgi:argininosuccinate lyase
MTAVTPAPGGVAPPAPAIAHKLWGGRFATGPAPAFEALNASIGVDFRLFPYDIRLSKAWAMGLYGAGVLSLDECHAIEDGLDAAMRRLLAGEQPAPGDEDVHTVIDRLLHEEAGDVASKLHTGRSRNDQVATATRMWAMEAATHVDAAIRALQRSMIARAVLLQDAIMPGYTHLQRAIPLSAAHWLLSHFWPLDRDRGRLHSARTAAGVLPLGSGALAGCAYPVSRVLLQGSLGFTSLSANSVDAVSDRDFLAELIFACTLAATHLSRFAEDMIIYGTSEFGFVRFGDSFTSGSSMMPQKRNPDALELARGSAARMLGDLTALLATLKGLPTSYNKDLQDDKRVAFDAVDTLLLVLPAVTGALEECEFDVARMRGAVSSTMMATDLADHLVRRGATFREAHSAVGRLVRLAEERDLPLDALDPETIASAHPLLGPDAGEALSAAASVACRELEGGTGPRAVRDQIEAAREAVARPWELAGGTSLDSSPRTPRRS